MAVLDLSQHIDNNKYSDGNIESFLLTELTNGKTPENLMETWTDWPIIYHLSPERQNILRWMDFDKSHDVLEIGAGCGAITSLLCEKFNTVTAVDLSLRRSSINYQRNKKYDNLTIYPANMMDFKSDKKYDVITLIGVFEYAIFFTDTSRPYRDFLNHIKNYLKPEGRIIIAIENRFGLKYFAGADEDHNGVPFSGIDGYSISGANTFTKSELNKIVADTEMVVQDVYYPFPDYKFPRKIVGENSSQLKHALNYIPNYGGYSTILFDENSVYSSMYDEGVAKTFANSFLYIIGKTEGEKNPTDYALMTTQRSYGKQLITRICNKDGKKVIVKTAVNKKSKQHLGTIISNYNMLSESFPTLDFAKPTQLDEVLEFEYIEGNTIEDTLLKCAANDDKQAFMKTLDIWVKFIRSMETPDSIEWYADIESGDIPDHMHPVRCIKPGHADLNMDNFILKDGKAVNIDYEWILPFPIPTYWVIYRGIKTLYRDNGSLNKFIPEEELMVNYAIDNINYDICNWLEAYLQSYVYSGSLFELSEKYHWSALPFRNNRTPGKLSYSGGDLYYNAHLYRGEYIFCFYLLSHDDETLLFSPDKLDINDVNIYYYSDGNRVEINCYTLDNNQIKIDINKQVTELMIALTARTEGRDVVLTDTSKRLKQELDELKIVNDKLYHEGLNQQQQYQAVTGTLTWRIRNRLLKIFGRDV